MREFFELVNEYPWTTFFLFWGCCCLLSSIGEAIHGPKHNIYINDKDKEND